MKIALYVLSLSAAFIVLCAPKVCAQPHPMDSLAFFIGEWDLHTYDIQPDGSYKEGRARSTAYRVLDGFAIQDDFRQVDTLGTVIFRGTSLRSYNPATQLYQVVWVMPGVSGITDLRGRFEGDDLVLTGEGYDVIGTFLEEARYFDITANSYSFTLKRSYDGGQTWIDPFGTIEAVRITDP